MALTSVDMIREIVRHLLDPIATSFSSRQKKELFRLVGNVQGISLPSIICVFAPDATEFGDPRLRRCVPTYSSRSSSILPNCCIFKKKKTLYSDGFLEFRLPVTLPSPFPLILSELF